jgi:Radical SAM superfamily
MALQRQGLYRFPWTQVDTPGTWIEVTDSCDLACPGCFRHRLEGHRPLDVIKEEIRLCQAATNCERVAVAGGEPLLYPQLADVVAYIVARGMKPVLMTNGESLTPEYARELKRAGLVQFYFHVDSGQQRPGWEGKDEIAANELRQHFADMVLGIKGVMCGYNITITRANLAAVPDIVGWGLANIDRVHSLSLIAIRGLLTEEGIEYRAGGRTVDTDRLQCRAGSADEYGITSDEMAELVRGAHPILRPSAYLNGTVDPSTNKFLVFVPIGSRGEIYGVCGPRAAELSQVAQHFFKGRYSSLAETPRPSKSVFLLAAMDREVRRAFKRFLAAAVRRPSRLFRKVHIQGLNLVQPTEIIGDERNFCDGCINLMPWKGTMVHSCVLDEYRMYGGPIKAVKETARRA